MWTEEKLKEAAEDYLIEHCYDLLNREGSSISLRTVFLAGCKYVINNTQKEVEKNEKN